MRKADLKYMQADVAPHHGLSSRASAAPPYQPAVFGRTRDRTTFLPLFESAGTNSTLTLQPTTAAYSFKLYHSDPRY